MTVAPATSDRARLLSTWRCEALSAVLDDENPSDSGAGRLGSEKVTLVADDEDAPWVAVTMHVPADVAVSRFPVTLHPVADPFVTEKLTDPVPASPLVASLSVEPTFPERVVTAREDDTAFDDVTTKVGSIENVTVTEPLAVAVPTASKPLEVIS